MIPKILDLALQGGGSHGAFTWGVMEALLEDERIKIDGLCGTSAGAMNATIFSYGMLRNGRKGAIDLLNKFWKRISTQQNFSVLQPSAIDKKSGSAKLGYSPVYQMFDFYTLLFSPYQFNPTDYNPLRDVLLEMIDFEELKFTKENKLFVCATNVRTGRAKVFDTKNISVDAVMASACLPFLFKAVEIDGEAYWDGGYMGNPPIFPLIDNAESTDVLLIQINPIEIEKIPQTADEIRDRINTLSFNTSLMHEMRRVNMLQRLLAMGLNIGDGGEHKILIHHINPQEIMAGMTASSKLNADWEFLKILKEKGKKAAQEWVKLNFDKIGKVSTCDIKDVFL